MLKPIISMKSSSTTRSTFHLLTRCRISILKWWQRVSKHSRLTLPFLVLQLQPKIRRHPHRLKEAAWVQDCLKGVVVLQDLAGRYPQTQVLTETVYLWARDMRNDQDSRKKAQKSSNLTQSRSRERRSKRTSRRTETFIGKRLAMQAHQARMWSSSRSLSLMLSSWVWARKVLRSKAVAKTSTLSYPTNKMSLRRHQGCSLNVQLRRLES